MLSKSRKWPEEIKALRKILLGFPLTEEMKWYQPCFRFQGRNVAIIGTFKEYCTLMFFKGALLKDIKGILVKPGEHSQASRQFRFTNVRDIVRMTPVLKSYIDEAIELEKAGKKEKFKRNLEPIPQELKKKMDDSPRLEKSAFDALTPGRQRAYILFISAAKQSETRSARVEKWRQQILNGKGLND